MADTQTALQMASTLLASKAIETTTPEAHRLDMSLATADLLAAVEILRDARWGYLAAITGLDLGVDAGKIEVLYQFCAAADVLTLRVRTSRTVASVQSICAIFPSASLHERELSEMLGVTIIGAPNTDRLFLPDEWPAGVYPLRKDFAGLES